MKTPIENGVVGQDNPVKTILQTAATIMANCAYLVRATGAFCLSIVALLIQAAVLALRGSL